MIGRVLLLVIRGTATLLVLWIVAAAWTWIFQSVWPDRADGDLRHPSFDDAPSPFAGLTWKGILCYPILAVVIVVGIPVLVFGAPVWIALIGAAELFHWIRWRLWGIPHPVRWKRVIQSDSWFWSVIEADGVSLRDDPVPHLESIHTRLSLKSPRDLANAWRFQEILNRKLAEARTWDLRGASYLINGRDSEEAFANFRSWLIARGESIYGAALLNADSLADVIEPYTDDGQLAGLRFVAEQVDGELDGDTQPDDTASSAAALRGTPLDFGDPEQVSRRLPRLAAMYLA